jgi:hypothetical protein
VTDVDENQNVNVNLASESSQKFVIDALQDAEMGYVFFSLGNTVMAS